MDKNDLKIAVIIPCYNEAQTIAKVVTDFRKSFSQADIFVFDNNSTDDTIEKAFAAGAIIERVGLQGKGNVVRRMFADIEADVYIMVDGDDTYDAPSSVNFVNILLEQKLDMVVGCRVEKSSGNAYRLGHKLGNKLFTSTVQYIFGGKFSDMFSGYRAFSRRYVKSFPAHTSGFEIETELTVHALELRMPCAEIKTPYGARPEGSTSKLSTYVDGIRIMKTILRLFMTECPLKFFGSLSFLLTLISIIIVIPVIHEFFITGLVRRFPTAILSVGLMLSALLSFFSGLLLDVVNRGRHEVRHLAYLMIKTSSPRL